MTPFATSPSWTAESDQAGAAFGYSVSTAGDVNGDGYSDVIVGAPLYDNGHTDEGVAFVYHGSASGLSISPNWTAESNQASAYFGRSVSTAGDVNGDGYSDVIVGAYYFDNGQTDEGRAFVYYGNDGASLSVLPRQFRSDSTTGISHLGKSDAYNSFYISAIGRSPMGRDWVGLEWEVKPLGTPFDGTGTSMSSGFADTGLTGVTITEQVSGLSGNTHYHWRARLRYEAGNPMGQVAGRWFSPFPNGWQEEDLKTAQNPDADNDGIPDASDNCPSVYNPDQADADNDGIGDVCDTCTDTDNDGYGNPGYSANTCPTDNCPDIYNPTQADADNDGIGDACDTLYNPYSISGKVFNDLNCNGQRNSGENGLSGVKVTLSPGAVVVYTASDGTYSFTGLPAGTYVVTETDPTGYISCTPNKKTVKISSRNVTNQNFGDQSQ